MGGVAEMSLSCAQQRRGSAGEDVQPGVLVPPGQAVLDVLEASSPGGVDSTSSQP